MEIKFKRVKFADKVELKPHGFIDVLDVSSRPLELIGRKNTLGDTVVDVFDLADGSRTLIATKGWARVIDAIELTAAETEPELPEAPKTDPEPAARKFKGKSIVSGGDGK